MFKLTGATNKIIWLVIHEIIYFNPYIDLLNDLEHTTFGGIRLCWNDLMGVGLHCIDKKISGQTTNL